MQQVRSVTQGIASHGAHVDPRVWWAVVGLAVAYLAIAVFTWDRRDSGEFRGRVAMRRMRRMFWCALISALAATAVMLTLNHLHHAQVLTAALAGKRTVPEMLILAGGGLTAVSTAVLFTLASGVARWRRPLGPPPPRRNPMRRSSWSRDWPANVAGGGGRGRGASYGPPPGVFGPGQGPMLPMNLPGPMPVPQGRGRRGSRR